MYADPPHSASGGLESGSVATGILVYIYLYIYYFLPYFYLENSRIFHETGNKTNDGFSKDF